LERPEQLAEMVESGDRFPFTMHPAPPLIHGAAQLASWITLLTGGKVVLVPERGFNAKRSAELIEREEVMVVNLVGDAMARPFAEVEHDHDLECLAVVQSAGAILSPSVREALVARFPEAMILNNLGASETGHQGTALDDGKPGRAVFETTDNNAVFDDELRRCGVGELGKLARRGHIPLGYYGDPEKTARTFFDIEGERWVIPGDYAMLTEQGTIVLLGRGAVCINTGGEKVFPEEVEEILKGDPGVMDALVVGLPDDRWGERVAAVVQKRDGSVRTSDEIDAHVRTKLAGYKAPRAYFFVEEVRRQPSGKPDYAWAKETAVRMAGA
jgi:acyl-CoA synthetase (AMP-forming)/AMP-acid ligase II